jgi:NAD(P)-dependent dehydrogenase (short-subunit alcohol dehydrogenase family)
LTSEISIPQCSNTKGRHCHESRDSFVRADFSEGQESPDHLYNVSKIGVIGLTRALSKEYGGDGFRVNVIIPGGIVTPGTKAVAKEIAQLKLGLIKTGLEFKARLPLNRGGQPDEVARIALVLASDLSSYVNGALIPVDGGFLSA